MAKAKKADAEAEAPEAEGGGAAAPKKGFLSKKLIIMVAAGLLVPSLLRPLNWLWFKFGMFLSMVMTPIVMGVLFVSTVVPTALVMRLRRRDLLRLKIDRQSKSYWIMREPPGPGGDTMRNQY